MFLLSNHTGYNGMAELTKNAMQCIRCKKPKPRGEFPPSDKTITGLSRICKSCVTIEELIKQYKEGDLVIYVSDAGNEEMEVVRIEEYKGAVPANKQPPGMLIRGGKPRTMVFCRPKGSKDVEIPIYLGNLTTFASGSSETKKLQPQEPSTPKT